MFVLETDRLIIRKFHISDVNDLYDYAKNPNVGPNAGWKPHKNRGETIAIIIEFIKSDEVWAIVEKRRNKVIGSIGLHKDRKRELRNAKMIGYVLSEDYWGKGYATEAVKRMLKYGFEELDLDLISVYHYPHNMRSRRVIEKCGFKYEGVLRKASVLYDGTVYDDVCYSMTKEDYYDMMGR
ncbi:MAG TPA: GNAT family N-acetyltransferase [Tissierellia bacterium]|nr:GNAT family N-acetyltransferase [Tissierellia bacterium]